MPPWPPWIAPEIREGTGEIEAAAAGSPPTLASRADIRGDPWIPNGATVARSSRDGRGCAGPRHDTRDTHPAPHSAVPHPLADGAKRQREEIDAIRQRSRDHPPLP
jgi:DNA polymerase (family 10)